MWKKRLSQTPLCLNKSTASPKLYVWERSECQRASRPLFRFLQRCCVLLQQIIKGLIWADDPDVDGEGQDARVHCDNCQVEGPVTDSIRSAVGAWNMRREMCRGE